MLYKNLRVIFCFGSLELGGSERQGLYLANHFKNEIGAHVEVWGFHGPGRLSDECDIKDIPWRIISFPLAKRGVRVVCEILKFSLMLRKEKISVLVPYTTMPNIVCALASVFGGVKVCAWNQRDEGLERYISWVENLALLIPRPIISNSVGSAQFLTITKGIPSTKISIISNGLELPYPQKSREEFRKDLGVADSVFLVCMIANISPFKDHETLIRAWKHVVNSTNIELKMIFAGNCSNTMALSNLSVIIDELELADSVRFLGTVDDITGLLDATDLVVHSSRSEGLSNAVIEAMCAGKAVIGTDIPGIRQVLGEGVFYSKIGDVIELGKLIMRYIVDDKLRKDMEVRNKCRAENLFSVRRMCNDMSDIILREL